MRRIAALACSCHRTLLRQHILLGRSFNCQGSREGPSLCRQRKYVFVPPFFKILLLSQVCTILTVSVCAFSRLCNKNLPNPLTWQAVKTRFCKPNLENFLFLQDCTNERLQHCAFCLQKPLLVEKRKGTTTVAEATIVVPCNYRIFFKLSSTM